MRVFITGIDGYLGWSLAMYLGSRDYVIGGMDNYYRRRCVAEIGSRSATPIRRLSERLEGYSKFFGKSIHFIGGDLTDYNHLKTALLRFKPDVIVHLGQMPSAPYSMIDVKHCIDTHGNNMFGTLNLIHIIRDYLPTVHLVKLGSMGEYGTPNVSIPEGYMTMTIEGREDVMQFPRKAGSWYHQTKVHDTNNIEMACRFWGLKATDIMQGVVFGLNYNEFSMDAGEELITRFDFDECFGTAINRFCAQAVIGEPITLYGNGQQKRGFLPLKDSMRCIELLIKNEPEEGEHRVVNQFEKVYDITELAEMVNEEAFKAGYDTSISNLSNPRFEEEEHFYEPDHQKLIDLGYDPTNDIGTEISKLITTLGTYRDRIDTYKHVLIPSIRWSGNIEECGEIDV